MRRTILMSLIASWFATFVPTGRAGCQDAEKTTAPARSESQPASPRARYKALVDRYEADEQRYVNAYRAAESDDERARIEKERPSREPTARAMVRLAEEAPGDPTAIDALRWAVAYVEGPTARQALEMLIDGYAADPRLGAFPGALQDLREPEARDFLRLVLAKNPNPKTRAWACYVLAELRQQDGDACETAESAQEHYREAEALFTRVIRDFDGPLYRTIGPRLRPLAERKLKELRTLSLGQPAPEIVGDDIDGQPMRLSDFKGRIVLLDFWGDW
jgi:hypothetical protein